MKEPRIIHQTRDIAGKDYDHFLDTLNGIGDKRPKEEKKEEVSEIQGEEL